MEKEIHNSLSNYYTILRDYQYELQNKINDIINKIQSTMDSNAIINLIDNYSIILDRCKEHKLISFLERILDICKKRKLDINIIDDKKSNDLISNIDLLYNNIIIIKIKIQLKKILLTIVESDILIPLNINKNKENKNNLDIINNFLSNI